MNQSRSIKKRILSNFKSDLKNGVISTEVMVLIATYLIVSPSIHAIHVGQNGRINININVSGLSGIFVVASSSDHSTKFHESIYPISNLPEVSPAGDLKPTSAEVPKLPEVSSPGHQQFSELPEGSSGGNLNNTCRQLARLPEVSPARGFKPTSAEVPKLPEVSSPCHLQVSKLPEVSSGGHPNDTSRKVPKRRKYSSVHKLSDRARTSGESVATPTTYPEPHGSISEYSTLIIVAGGCVTVLFVCVTYCLKSEFEFGCMHDFCVLHYWSQQSACSRGLGGEGKPEPEEATDIRTPLVIATESTMPLRRIQRPLHR